MSHSFDEYLTKIRKCMELLYNKTPVKNVFNTNYSKCVLISYISLPFRFQNNFCHSNSQEVKQIAEVFKTLGFNVDVYNFLYTHSIDYSKYDVIFGFGNLFENSFYTAYQGIRVFYATGAHVCFQNHAEAYRIKELEKRKGKLLIPRRMVPNSWSASTELSDAIISIGNDWTASTYKKFFNGPVYNIPVTSYSFYPADQLERNWDIAKKNFLWIGGDGLTHKGLDLCLDIFNKLPDLNLHICGPKENDFFDLYYNELHNYSNIQYHGFVDISSEKFQKITSTCGFVLYPTCSEGQASSVITGMFTGLIPIVTRESGINIEEYGFLIDDIDIQHLKDLVVNVSETDSRILNQKSLMAFDHCCKYHTIENFRSQFMVIIRDLLL